jgi:hypothetical protein
MHATLSNAECGIFGRTVEENIAGMVLVAFTATQNDIMVVRLNAVSWDVLDGDSGVHCINRWLPNFMIK